MSCIAGPGQFGTEDQGWVAHFVYSILEAEPITIYGNGCQVRDVLHVHDLIDAMQTAHQQQEKTAGQIYNLGGGIERAVSIAEMLDAISEQTGLDPILRSSGVRPGDQPLYISDTGKFAADTSWAPRRSLRQTLESIQDFWRNNRGMLSKHRDMLILHELAVEEVA
jgi:CDP-paratose 2-epimerase